MKWKLLEKVDAVVTPLDNIRLELGAQQSSYQYELKLCILNILTAGFKIVFSDTECAVDFV